MIWCFNKALLETKVPSPLLSSLSCPKAGGKNALAGCPYVTLMPACRPCHGTFALKGRSHRTQSQIPGSTGSALPGDPAPEISFLVPKKGKPLAYRLTNLSSHWSCFLSGPTTDRSFSAVLKDQFSPPSIAPQFMEVTSLAQFALLLQFLHVWLFPPRLVLSYQNV